MTTSPETLAATKTKIVATLGPASDSAERLAELIGAGVDVFRLNMVHGRPEWRELVIARIRDSSARLDRPVAVLADLGGPKIRLGPIIGGSVQLAAGQVVRFVATTTAVSHPTDLTATYESLVRELKVGDPVLLSDGTVSLKVIEKTAGAAVCSVVQAGEIRSGSGINLPGVALEVAALTEKDRADLAWAAAHGVDFIGLSFVRRAADVRELRAELARLDSSAQIVAKIEKPEAVAAIDEIIAASDAIMVARGDLGVETDVARVAIVQKDIIRRANLARVPVITATQMLESMRSSRLPTRAEATDVANAILDGTDAVMLSAETAMGQYPVEAVAMMNRIAREAEQLLAERSAARQLDGPLPVAESLVEAASHIAAQVAAKLTVVATTSGRTALLLSKQRSRTPTLGVSDCAATVRRMCLYWGVYPFAARRFSDNQELLTHLSGWARAKGLLSTGDRVVLIAGSNWTSAEHNMIAVANVS